MGIDNVLPKIDLTQFLGQWIIICEDKVIAHNKDLTKLTKDIKNCKRAPTITKIPKEDTLIF